MDITELFSNNGFLLDYNYLKNNYNYITEKFGKTPNDILNILAVKDYNNGKIANAKFKWEQSLNIKFHEDTCFNLSFIRLNNYILTKNFFELQLAFKYVKILFENLDVYKEKHVNLFFRIYMSYESNYKEYLRVINTCDFIIFFTKYINPVSI